VAVCEQMATPRSEGPRPSRCRPRGHSRHGHGRCLPRVRRAQLPGGVHRTPR
jgi:hypothetical protein